MNHVLSSAEPRGNQRLVLAVLADRADERGCCHPGVAWLARRTAMSERSVQRALAQLVDAGWIERHTNAGPGQRPDRRPSLYRILLSRGDSSVTPKNAARGDNTDTPHGVSRGDSSGTPKGERGDNIGRNGVTKLVERGDKTVTLTVRGPSIEPSEGDSIPLAPSAGASEQTPSLAEWIAYAGSIGYIDEADATQAWHNYESTKTARGWWVQRGGKRITNWRSACVTCRGNWQRFRKAERPGGGGGRREEKIGEASGAVPGGIHFTEVDTTAEPVAAGEGWGLGFARAEGGES